MNLTPIATKFADLIDGHQVVSLADHDLIQSLQAHVMHPLEDTDLLGAKWAR